MSLVPGPVGAGAVADDLNVAGSVPGREEVDLRRRHQRGNLLREVKRFRLQVLKQIEEMHQELELKDSLCVSIFSISSFFNAILAY